MLAVLSHENAPRLQPVEDGELAVLQSPDVSYRGQVVAVAVADTLEAAREAAALVRVEYDEQPHDVLLRPGHPKLYRPEVVNAAFPADTRARRRRRRVRVGAAVQVDATYTHAGAAQQPDGAARDARRLGGRRR